MIYCVEDEQNICELEVYTLQSVGFEAKGCSSGKELFAELVGLRFSLVHDGSLRRK